MCACLCVPACARKHIHARPPMRNSPGTLLPSRDEEVLEVKAGDPVLQWRLLLHGGGDASGSRPSQAHTTAKTQPAVGAGLGGEAGPEMGRMVMGRESTIKSKAHSLLIHILSYVRLCLENIVLAFGIM